MSSFAYMICMYHTCTRAHWGSLLLLLVTFGCQAQQEQTSSTAEPEYPNLQHLAVPAAEFPELYLPYLQGKDVGLVINHTSVVAEEHMVDVLHRKDVTIKKIFAPEHGYRGDADAGEHVADGKDVKTGAQIISLYGKKKKPSAEDLKGLDVLLFDIQDVGVRFYTYISTLHYIMEACAENDIHLIVLDRPNPHVNYIDGPILEEEHKSFVGMHPVPVVYGMTIGEYALMINGEGWLSDGRKCDLQVISCPGYQRHLRYQLPIKPSPNLPTERSILLYPSLCFFEGTVISAGRGTDRPFECYGHPLLGGDYSFTPVSTSGAKYPKHQDQLSHGENLRDTPIDALLEKKVLDLQYLLAAYQNYPDRAGFFLKSGFFEKLAGTRTLRAQIEEGISEDVIRASWQDGLQGFDKIRRKYLLYE